MVRGGGWGWLGTEVGGVFIKLVIFKLSFELWDGLEFKKKDWYKCLK